MSNSQTQAPGPKSYFTLVPNIVLHLGLSPHALALYLAIRRAAGDDGTCTKSTATLAREAGMSAGMVTNAKQELLRPRDELSGGPLIRIYGAKVPGKKNAHHIRLTDIWRINEATAGGNALRKMASLPPRLAESSASLVPLETIPETIPETSHKPPGNLPAREVIDSETSPETSPIHPMNASVHLMNDSCSPDEIKKNQTEEEQERTSVLSHTRECLISSYSSSGSCTLEQARAYAESQKLTLTAEMVEHWWNGMEARDWHLAKGGKLMPVRDWRSLLRSSVEWLQKADTGQNFSPSELTARKAGDKREPSPMKQWAISIVRAYPGTGSDAGAIKKVITVLKAGTITPYDLNERVAIFAERYRRLPPEERRWCPQKYAFFQNERWLDDPDSNPWVYCDPRASRRR